MTFNSVKAIHQQDLTKSRFFYGKIINNLGTLSNSVDGP
ncbi:hypothetical protein LAC1533_0579 [Ligilactobacillus acidipiscis]|uniref:Uncharacterized protein n=1 Tax=Ligilactobacillus acidipiscis TaxID=89059 RepID=A0A1K1KM89_9LACO|nr:hypothetical protein LAC1533_0579 [Ligilactobacillus acidipiscis]